jgi:dienelactone hydrolase
LKRRLAPLALAIVLLPATAGADSLIPDSVQVPLLTRPVPKGKLLIADRPAVQPSAKTVDADPSDWIGTPTRLGGTSILSAGELVYQDYIHDDHGADDGQDVRRVALLDPFEEMEDRTYRGEVLAQALGEQFGAPDDGTDDTKALVADANYGDADQGPAKNEADLTEVRLAADGSSLFILARFGGMADDSRTGLVVLLDDPATDAVQDGPGGLTTTADRALVLHGSQVLQELQSGVPVPASAGIQVATDGTGFTNTIEASIPLSELPAGVRLGVASAIVEDGQIRATKRGSAASELINVAFRSDEPVRIWNDREQALALHSGNIDRYLVEVPIAALQAGADQAFVPSPGYFERTYVSDSPVNQESESGQYFQGPWQHYGLYLPSSWRPGRELGVSWWTHYRGGHAHDAASWLPGLLWDLGERIDRIVVTPGARGTSTWYVGRGMEDFLDVWDDFDASFAYDPDRVIMSGYSMGGYASWLLPLLMPDRFAGSFPTAGPPTQGLYAGVGDALGEANGAYDADAQLMLRMVPNASNMRYAIYHGTNDELVPYTGVTRMAAELTLNGIENRFYTMPGYEHYTHAIVDDWRAGSKYLAEAVRDPSPDEVTFIRWPALERAVNTVGTPVPLSHRFDSAYWVSGIELRDAGTPDANGRPPLDLTARVDARTFARGLASRVPVPEAGSVVDHVTPYFMTGLGYHELSRGPRSNRFDATLTNTASVALDTNGMQLDRNAPMVGTITTDGGSSLTLKGTFPPSQITIDLRGETPTSISVSMASGDLTLTLPQAGTYSVSIVPLAS